MTASVTPSTLEPSDRLAGAPVWRADRGPARVRFVGRGRTAPSAASLLGQLAGAPTDLARARQMHSDRVLVAVPGDCGEGDALVTRRRGLALAIATADCVPCALLGQVGTATPGADGRALAAIHAGWRGIASGIARRAVEALAGPAEAAWLGPAIGPCCYEVGDDVAERVAGASGPEVIVQGAGERPHLDLRRALEIQLGEAGVPAVHRLGPCTRCHPELLWSYRREGVAGGRNWLFAWLT